MLCSLLLAAAQAAEPDPIRILVYTESAGFVHAVARRPPDGSPCLVERQWLAWDAEDPRFAVEVSRDPGLFTSKSLAGFDAVFFYTTGELPIPEAGREALLQFVRDGGGFSGSHCASDTFYQWPAYGDMVGGYFDGHPWHQEVRVRVEDPSHPASAWLPDGFSISDEIYQFRDPWSRERAHVLLSLDVASVDLGEPRVRREDHDFALAWTREEGDGRVFYTALGHRPEVWRDSRFRDHLVEGTLWAAARPPPAQADHVLIVSVDGLRSDVLPFGGPQRLPHFHRLLQGCGTFNARTDPDSTVTLPNHIGMMTGRTMRGTGGHGWEGNEDPPPSATFHRSAGEYVAGMFDVAHDRGVRTALHAAKTKFSLFRESWGERRGAADEIGVDQGRNKLDVYQIDLEAAKLTAAALGSLSSAPRTLVFLHYRDPDVAGHDSTWQLDFESPYWRSITVIDAELGRILAAIEEDPRLRGRTAIVLTSDHGGGAPDWSHTRSDLWVNYVIPFIVWPGSGRDLYEANPDWRADPGLGQPGPAADPPPVRNSDAAGVALQLLGLAPQAWKR